MKIHLQFSVLITVTGNLLDSRYHHDMTLRDFVRDCDEILGASKPTTPGDSEYSYLTKEGRAEGFKLAVIESLDGGNREIAAWALERYNHDSDIWWATCSDYQNSGILQAAEFFRFVDGLGLSFEDCATMGTLGGTLSLGCVPDVAFNSDSQAVIVSMRATPFFVGEDGEANPVSEATWERLKKYYSDPWKICRTRREKEVAL